MTVLSGFGFTPGFGLPFRLVLLFVLDLLWVSTVRRFYSKLVIVSFGVIMLLHDVIDDMTFEPFLVSPPVCPGFTFGLHSPSVLVSINERLGVNHVSKFSSSGTQDGGTCKSLKIQKVSCTKLSVALAPLAASKGDVCIYSSRSQYDDSDPLCLASHPSLTMLCFTLQIAA